MVSRSPARGVGTSSQLIGELFQAEAGVKMTHVPYQGGAQLFSDLLSGIVSMCFYPYQQFQTHLQSGRIRAIAVTTEKRQSFLPDLPTFTELGFPKMVLGAFLSVWVPANTPEGSDRQAQCGNQSCAVEADSRRAACCGWLSAGVLIRLKISFAFTMSEMDKCKAIVNLAGVKVE